MCVDGIVKGGVCDVGVESIIVGLFEDLILLCSGGLLCEVLEVVIGVLLKIFVGKIVYLDLIVSG